jgi:hypothetical protein
MARVKDSKKLKKPDWFNLENYDDFPFDSPKEIAIYLSFYNMAVTEFSAYQKKYSIESEDELSRCLSNAKADSRVVQLYLKLLKDKYLPVEDRVGVQKIFNVDWNNPLSIVPIGEILEDQHKPDGERRYLKADIDSLLAKRKSLNSPDPKPAGFDVYRDEERIILNLDDMTQNSPTECAKSVVTAVSLQDEDYISKTFRKRAEGVKYQGVNSTKAMKDIDKMYLSVNLAATNEQLLESFTNLLSEYRQQSSEPNKRLKDKILEIAKYKSIQILDLELYASLIGKKVTIPTLEKFVFPEGFKNKAYFEDSFKDANKPTGTMRKNRSTITKPDFIQKIMYLRSGD